jgi:sulfite reductase alpha subunit-like flavoprotein
MSARLGVQPDHFFSITENATIPSLSMVPRLPAVASLRKFLTSHCDLNSPAKRAFLELCRDYATNPKEKEYLSLLCSKEDNGKVNNPFLSDFFAFFPHTRERRNTRPTFPTLSAIQWKFWKRFLQCSCRWMSSLR